jgi:preprotein translocase subunit YajC
MSILLIWGGILLLFYFLLIRPQQRMRRQHAQLVSSLQPGDEVVTQSGIIGTITELTGEVAFIEIQEDIELRVMRSAIGRRIEPHELAAAEGDEESGDADEGEVSEAVDEAPLDETEDAPLSTTGTTGR